MSHSSFSTSPALESDEFHTILKQVSRYIRTNGYYELPKVRAYPVTVAVLDSMVLKGLLTKGFNGSKPIYHATSLMSLSYDVREVVANKIQEGFMIGIAHDNLGQVNERFFETSRESFEKLGVVTSIKEKKLPKNLFERLTFKQSVDKIEITFLNNDSVLLVDPDSIFFKFR